MSPTPDSIEYLSFRAGWCEATVKMNIATLAAIMAMQEPTVERLLFAIKAVKEDSEAEIARLDEHSRGRLLSLAETPPANILELFKPKVAEPPKAPTAQVQS